jgi:hypothetical protein
VVYARQLANRTLTVSCLKGGTSVARFDNPDDPMIDPPVFTSRCRNPEDLILCASV